MQQGIYKDIPEYEGHYQASDMANIKSIKFGKEIIMKQCIDSGGYYTVVLYKFGKQRTFKVSVLIAMAFLNHKPNGHDIVVDHKDNIKTNDYLYNIQLITSRENGSKDRKGISKYTGVSWHKTNKKWYCSIGINGKKKYLGYFENEIDAHNAYQKELIKLNE